MEGQVDRGMLQLAIIAAVLRVLHYRLSVFLNLLSAGAYMPAPFIGLLRCEPGRGRPVCSWYMIPRCDTAHTYLELQLERAFGNHAQGR